MCLFKEKTEKGKSSSAPKPRHERERENYECNHNSSREEKNTSFSLTAECGRVSDFEETGQHLQITGLAETKVGGENKYALEKELEQQQQFGGERQG